MKKITSTLRDSKDNIFLQLAIASQASYIITLDNDLLDLKFYGKTKIITPQGFMKKLTG
ncbi:putative toxin-antitoxin system toxin component, PIN family [Candidatus Roizmanbacteria bacterium RIFCSPHIGHO2_12_FULL_41_11]|uniref:Putative toxin-antitoxin system toxin component, PIN family n=2 Tax=Candidatus Roizmaniibacteriota TaxID=1752723 RepID=A0A1F7J7V8_9BACT|nr:MAG: putative toxin-antitoxin system toxin component, PIN family [Candidatus Roizmanbacteria bacterium RIFCSPHIGHO2_12_FULL_41_11]OGK51696.1 MAG: putative toxin-antitoxin system toxin component, PIN family [Candidatus Roizmanbacteria bacterium RIFCSPLOWO2_01_FULL_41_22]